MILFVSSDFGELDANSYIIECVSRLQSIAPDNYKQMTFTEMAMSCRALDNKYIIGMVAEFKINDNFFKEHLILGEIATLTQEKTITLEFLDEYKNLSQIIHVGDLIMLYNFRLENLKNTNGRGRRPANMLPHKITSAFEGFKLFFMNGNSYNLNNIQGRIEIEKLHLELSDYGNCENIKQITRTSSNTFQESVLFTEDVDVVAPPPTQNDRKKRSKTPLVNGLKAKEQERQAKSQRIRRIKKAHQAVQRAASKKSNKDEQNAALNKDLISESVSSWELSEYKTEIQKVFCTRDRLLLSAKKSRQKSKSKLQNNNADSLSPSTVELTSIKNIKPKCYFNLECQVLGVLTNDNSDMHCILLCWDGTKPRVQFQSPSMGQWSDKFKDNEYNLLSEYTLFINIFGDHVIRLHELKLHQLIRVTNVHAKFVQRKLMCDLNVGRGRRGLRKMNENTEWSKALEDRLFRCRSAIKLQRHIETFGSVLSSQGKEAVKANNKKIEECLDVHAIIDNCDQLLTIFSTKLSDEKKKSSDEKFIDSAERILSSIEKFKASIHNIANEEDELINMEDQETNQESDCLKIENIYSLSNLTALEMWNRMSENPPDAHDNTTNSEELEIEFEAHHVKTGMLNLKSELPDPIDPPGDSLEWVPPNLENDIVENGENIESNENIVVPETLSLDMRPGTFSNECQPLHENNHLNKRQREVCDEEIKRSKPADPTNDKNNNPFELNRISRITNFQGKFSTIPELNSAADQQVCSFRGVILDVYPRSDHVIDAFKLSCRGCKNTYPINNQRQRECRVSGTVCDVAPSLHFKFRLCDRNKDIIDVIIRDENTEKLFWGTQTECLRSPENLKLLAQLVKNLCRSPAHLSSSSYVLHCNVKVSVERKNQRTFYLQDTVLECGGKSHNNQRIPY